MKAMGLELMAWEEEVYLEWVFKGSGREEENRVWCFRSQGGIEHFRI